MAGRLAGKVALITGAARGIGERAAERFAQEGAAVVVSDLDAAAVAVVAERIGNAALPLALNVTRSDQWAGAVEQILARWGRLDVLVANAGLAGYGPIETADLEEHRRIVDVNINGVFYGMQAVVPAMRASGGGSIINMSSIDGMVGVAGFTSYVGTKFAVRGMSRAAALELGQHGIRVNSLHPGVIDTPLVRPGLATGKVQAMIARQPIARIGTTDDVANLLIFLASEESSFCTGGEYVIDGGQLAGPVRG